jgi:hypothetical protein
MGHRLTLALLMISGFAMALPLGRFEAAPAWTNAPEQAAIQEAAGWIGRENKIETEYRYVMTCRARFVFFWAGSDDVGGGYVRIGKSSGDERQQMIQILFGSDPAKAPLAINRWGGGTEVLRSGDPGQPDASAFFGFMKSSKGQSVLAMRSELSKEKSNGAHLFEGIISRVDQSRALTASVPYSSSRDLDLHQYTEAEKATLEQLRDNSARQIRGLEGPARQACPRTGQFLSTTLQLMSDAVAGHPTPEMLCYLYNARHYQATLLSVRPVPQRTVHVALRGNRGFLDRNYRDLKDAHFEVLAQESGAKTVFDVLLGTQGMLRGVPLQISYQPNWWFQIVLNLVPNSLRSDSVWLPR